MPGFRIPQLPRHKRGVPVEIAVKGLRKTQAKLEQVVADINGGPMLRGMRDAALLVTNSAKKNSPVDTGRLRASITPSVKTMPNGGIMGIVGSNVRYAPYQEFGTRFMQGRFYLRRAVEQNQDKITQILGHAIAKIVAK